jgi:hypothetical protein
MLLAHQLLSSLPTSCGLGAYGPGPVLRKCHTTMSPRSVWGQVTVKSDSEKWGSGLSQHRVRGMCIDLQWYERVSFRAATAANKT